MNKIASTVDIKRNIAPDWVIPLMLGPHWPRLRLFAKEHPEVTLTASHLRLMLEFFTELTSIS